MSKQSETLDLDPNGSGAAFIDDDREPEINADFSKTVVIDTRLMDWQASPAAGVWRKRLELIGSQNPRLTTIVRFDPGGRFDEHGHPGGEEFLVLSGTFSDASGDFSKGSYVRNPMGWVHAPWTEGGCELFVKLCQFQTDDKKRVVIDSHVSAWQPSNHPGLSVLPLHTHGAEAVSLYRVAAGAQALVMDYPKGAEILLLEGDFEDESQSYAEGSWLRLPPGTEQVLSSKQGCRFYCKTGRLSR